MLCYATVIHIVLTSIRSPSPLVTMCGRATIHIHDRDMTHER